jgi:hypothetical protein
MRRRRIALLGTLVVLTLVVLAGALPGTEFRGGRPLPSANPAGSLAPLPPSRFPSANWVWNLLRLFLFLGLILCGIALLLFQNFRKQALYLLAVLGTFALAWYFLARLPPADLREMAAPAGPPEEGGEAAAGVPKAPGWAIYLAAVGLGSGVALWLGLRLFSQWERKRARRAVEEVVQEAVADLRRGAPVTDVVMRAWLRMVEILSARTGFRDRPNLTAREFAENLARLGFRHEAVELLTKLFEEVRYGHKDSEARREQALAALAALEQAYA